MKEAPFRIASRQEGEFVNFYFANDKDMKNALLLLSVRMSVMNVVGWEYFKEATVQAVKAGLSEVGVTTSDWTTIPAPEHEKAGRG